MRACLFAASYLDGADFYGGSYFERWLKYLEFYRPLKEEIGFQDFVLIDNASSFRLLSRIDASDVKIQRYPLHLFHGKGSEDYPYGWRMVWAANDFLSCYDKIIFLDSDGFVLSKRLATWIRDMEYGWQSLYCPKYGMPEGNLHVLCKESYPRFRKYTEGDFWAKNHTMMERDLPFTHVNRDFVSDRFGEANVKQEPWMDFYAQCRLETKMEYLG